MHDDHFHCYDHSGKTVLFKRSDTHKRGDKATKKKPEIEFYSLKQDLTALAARSSGRATLSVLGTTPGKRDIMLLKVGTDFGKKTKPKILLTGGMHAREWISPTYTFLVAEWLIDQFGSKSEAKDIVENFHLFFIPMCNPDGHEYSVTTNRMWRKNSPEGDPDFQTAPGTKAAGVQKGAPESVDLNRNFNTKNRAAVLKSLKGQWSDDVDDDSFVGTATAAETTILEKLMTAEKFDVMVDHHSFGCWVLHSPGDDHRPLATIDATAATRYGVVTGHMAKLLNAGSKKNPTTRKAPDTWEVEQASLFYMKLRAKLGGVKMTPEESVVPGSIKDFAFYQSRPKGAHRPLCFTIEMPPLHYTGTPGFELPEGKISAVFKIALPNTLALIKHALTASPTEAQWNAFSHLP
jgi:hypothetical protein